MIASAIGIAAGRLPTPSGVLGRAADAADCCNAVLGELALDLGVVALGECGPPGFRAGGGVVIF